jgi:hypothetical protein
MGEQQQCSKTLCRKKMLACLKKNFCYSGEVLEDVPEMDLLADQVKEGRSGTSETPPNDFLTIVKLLQV